MEQRQKSENFCSKTFYTKVSVDIRKSPSTQYWRDNVALTTTYIKNVKFKIVKIKTGYQHVGYLYYGESLNWAAQNRLSRMRATRWTQLV